MNKTQPNYRSYLIRLWRMDNAGQPVWRAALWTYLVAQIGLVAAEETCAHDPPER